MTSNLPAAVQGFLPQDTDAIAERLAAAGDSMSRMSGGVQFLKFSKGEWSMGRENATFPGNEFYCIPNLTGIQHGWQCWKGGQIEDERMHSIADELEPKGSLPDHGPYRKEGDGWSKAIKLSLLIVQEGSPPILALYTSSSAGGVNAVGELLKTYGTLLRTGKYAGQMPLVKCGTDSYKHNDYGKVHFPTFSIEDWWTEAQINVLLKQMPQAAAAPVAPPAPAPRPAPAPVAAVAPPRPAPKPVAAPVTPPAIEAEAEEVEEVEAVQPTPAPAPAPRRRAAPKPPADDDIPF